MKTKSILFMFLLFSLWQVALAKQFIFDWNLVNEGGGIQDMHFMPDESKFILTTTGKEVQIRKSLTGELIQKYPGIEGLFELTPDGTRIVNVIGPIQGTKIELRSLSDLSLIKSDSLVIGPDSLDPVYHTKLHQYILNLAIDPIRPYVYLILQKTNNIASPNVDTVRVIVYNYETMKQIMDLTPAGYESQNARLLAVSGDGKYLAVLNEGKAYLKVWSLDSMKLTRNFRLYDQNLKDNWCYPRDLKFSINNTNNVYFSASLPSQAGGHSGLFIYNIQSDLIIDSTFQYIIKGPFCLFDNENRAILTTSLDVRVLNFISKESEYIYTKQLPQPGAWGRVIYSKQNDIFIGWIAEYFSMGRYDRMDAVPENNIEKTIAFYPNPASDYIEISFSPSREGAGGVSIEIYDVFGIKVEHPPTPSFQEGELRVDVSGLTAGVYFVRVGSKTERFVIVR